MVVKGIVETRGATRLTFFSGRVTSPLTQPNTGTGWVVTVRTFSQTQQTWGKGRRKMFNGAVLEAKTRSP
jgi:hypothetical protein